MILKCLILLLCWSGTEWSVPMGADHQDGDLPVNTQWAEGLYEAVNQKHRIHGFWVNWTDVLFYQGDNDRLQSMVTQLDQVPDISVQVVIHAGKGRAISPWSEQPKGHADWSVVIVGMEPTPGKKNAVEVNVWLDHDIDLKTLELPGQVSVKSGDEIQAFLERHKRSSTDQ